MNQIGIIILKTNHPVVPYLKHIPGGVFDEVVLRKFKTRHPIRFLQIGANDGNRNDPIAKWIESEKWQGTLVEPIPYFANQLREKYKTNSNIQVLEVAVAEKAGNMTMYGVNPKLENLPDWAGGLSTLDKNRILEATKALKLDSSAIQEYQISVVTWKEIFQEHQKELPNLVVLDTEGYDIRLIHLLLDQNIFPEVIHFEHACATDEDKWQLFRRLVQNKYEIATFGPDTTAFLKENDS